MSLITKEDKHLINTAAWDKAQGMYLKIKSELITHVVNMKDSNPDKSTQEIIDSFMDGQRQ